jgi:hypothetical protein
MIGIATRSAAGRRRPRSLPRCGVVALGFGLAVFLGAGAAMADPPWAGHCNKRLRGAVCTLADSTRVGARPRPRRHPAHGRRRLSPRRELPTARGNRHTVTPCTRRSLPRNGADLSADVDLDCLTRTAALGRAGACRFAPAEPPGGLSLLPFAQRAICVRGVARGSGGCAPGPHAGSARPALDGPHPWGVDTGRPLHRFLWMVPASGSAPARAAT